MRKEVVYHHSQRKVKPAQLQIPGCNNASNEQQKKGD